MALTVHTDHDAIAAVLDGVIAADPVRGTTLGTIRHALEDAAWLAVDGAVLAVRSGRRFPLVLAGDWTADQLVALGRLAAQLPDLAGTSGQATYVDALIVELDVDVASRLEQRLFRLDALDPPRDVPGSAVRGAAGDRPLVRDWFAAFSAEAGGIVHDSRGAADRALDERRVWLWHGPDGAPVSLAARRPVIAGSSRIGPVYTPPEQRGHGYGSAVTAAATRDVLDDGGIPVLFTDLANPTANKIYRQLGYRPVEDRTFVLFD